MNRKQTVFLAVLGIATAALVGCGDNNDKRLTDADVACLKLLRAGMNCGPVNGGTNTNGGTVTATATSTVTVTNTTVVNH